MQTIFVTVKSVIHLRLDVTNTNKTLQHLNLDQKITAAYNRDHEQIIGPARDGWQFSLQMSL